MEPYETRFNLKVEYIASWELKCTHVPSPNRPDFRNLIAYVYLSSQVEFVEEVQPGELSVSDFATPSDNGDGLWNVSGRLDIKNSCLI